MSAYVNINFVYLEKQAIQPQKWDV